MPFQKSSQRSRNLTLFLSIVSFFNVIAAEATLPHYLLPKPHHFTGITLTYLFTAHQHTRRPHSPRRAPLPHHTSRTLNSLSKDYEIDKSPFKLPRQHPKNQPLHTSQHPHSLPWRITNQVDPSTNFLSPFPRQTSSLESQLSTY